MSKMMAAILALSLTASLLFGCHKNDEEKFLGSGTLEALEVVVSSLLPGRLDSLLVSEGDSVQAGRTIGIVDTDKLQAQLRQSTAGLEELAINRRVAGSAIDQAQEQHDNIAHNLARQKVLFESGSSTQQIVDDLTTQEAVAASRLQAARDQLAALEAKEKQLLAARDLINLQIQDAVITAPRSGSVIEKYAEAGEILTPNGKVVKIADLKRLWIKVYLDETEVGLVSLGFPVQVRVDALPNHSFTGRVSWISPRAEFTPRNVQTRQARADLVFAVKVEFENPEGTAAMGMPADVYLP